MNALRAAAMVPNRCWLSYHLSKSPPPPSTPFPGPLAPKAINEGSTCSTWHCLCFHKRSSIRRRRFSSTSVTLASSCGAGACCLRRAGLLWAAHPLRLASRQAPWAGAKPECAMIISLCRHYCRRRCGGGGDGGGCCRRRSRHWQSYRFRAFCPAHIRPALDKPQFRLSKAT